MRMKTQRILAAMLSLVLLLALAPAGWAVNFEQACSITVQPAAADAKHEDGTEFVSDINASTTPFVYDLYRVAYAKEVPGYDTYDYTLVDQFKESTELTNKIASDPTQRNAEFWADLAQQAAKIALGLNGGTSPITPVGGSTVGNAMGTAFTIPGIEVTSGEGTEATTKTISAGLYLVITRSNDYAWNKTTDYVIEKDNVVSTLAHTDQWDYYYAPQLISIPTKPPLEGGEEDGVIKTSNPGAWIYEPTAVLKPTAKPRYGILKITKTLTNYADLSKNGSYFEPMTFTFSVVGEKDGKTVYQKVVALSVDSPVDEALVATLEDIPVGTEVIVTEVYDGAHASGQTGPQRAVIQAPNTTTAEDGTTTTFTSKVSFTNVNDNTHRGGHGIENKFTFNKSNGGWGWVATGGDGATSGSEVEE